MLILLKESGAQLHRSPSSVQRHRSSSRVQQCHTLLLGANTEVCTIAGPQLTERLPSRHIDQAAAAAPSDRLVRCLLS